MIVLYGGAVLCSSFLRPHGARGENAAGGWSPASPNADIIAVAEKLHVKFQGSASCSGNSCHGRPTAAKPPAQAGNENTLWKKKDAHHKAFKTLTNAKSKKIAASPLLNISDATKSENAWGAMPWTAPPELQMQGANGRFDVTEGVTCTSCHGPYEKWAEPHQKHGWIAEQRKAMDHKTLLETFGRYDTMPLLARARNARRATWRSTRK